MIRFVKPCLTLLVLSVSWATPRILDSAPIVWSGLNHRFTKTVAIPADQITQNVALTRGPTRGLYNAEIDLGYNGMGPSDTEWATSLTSGNATIAASNWPALTFASWLTAFGGSGQVGRQITGRNAVVHLISEDIYLDIRFTNWQSNGGAFSYLRAVPLTGTRGDYNRSGTIDAADYTLWRDTLGRSVTPGQGADGDGNGMIDPADYSIWKVRFGQRVSASGGLAIVPEPTVPALALLAALTIACRRTVRWPRSPRDL